MSAGYAFFPATLFKGADAAESAVFMARRFDLDQTH